ncbi:MAG TPA: hypothetical protein VNK82_06020 [Terriglobales bacterium]|nr:hypothetical protein [Terriglobales bacterium]
MRESELSHDERMATALAAFAASVREQGERPEAYWFRQRVCIADGIAQHERSSSLRLAWAGALAVVTLAALMVTGSQPPMPRGVAYDPDHDLLLRVENATRRPVPKALDPALLLAQEMERSAQSQDAKP